MKLKTILLFSLIFCISCNQRLTPPNPEPDPVIRPDIEENWNSSPRSNSSKIKVMTDLTPSALNSIMVSRLRGMGFSIENSDSSYIESKPLQSQTQSIKVKIWIEGSQIVLLSQNETFEEGQFGSQPQTNGFVDATRGNTSTMSEGWRTLLMLSRDIAGERRYN